MKDGSKLKVELVGSAINLVKIVFLIPKVRPVDPLRTLLRWDCTG